MKTQAQIQNNRDRSARWKKDHPEKYNAYMRDYMRERARRIREEGTPQEQARARKKQTAKQKRYRHKKRDARIAKEAEETRLLLIARGINPSQI